MIDAALVEQLKQALNSLQAQAITDALVAVVEAAVEAATKRAYIPASKSVEHGTPPELFAQLAAEFGPFDLDVAASDELHLCDAYFTKELDGLSLPWFGTCWCNPPYGRGIKAWLRKAFAEVAAGRARRVVFLIPAATSTKWWHRMIVPNAAVVRLLEGRLTFVGATSCAPFASAVVVFDQASSPTT